MKLNTTLLSLAMAVTGPATSWSQTVVRIVASNGDRTATQTAISNILAPGWTFNGLNGFVNSSVGGFALANATNANYGTWLGSYAGSPIRIKVAYAGALAGIQAVAGNVQQKFAPTNGTNDGTVVNPLITGNAFELGTADFGFSTNFQATSPYNNVYESVTYSPIVEETVGVSPLGFYASPGFPMTGANITTQLAQLLYTSGSVTLAQFTGDFTNDVNKRVYAIGRNSDAGQRYGAYSEIGLGTTSTVRVYFPSISGRSSGAGGIIYGGTVDSHQLWPVSEQPGGIAQPPGSGGYSSGALVADKLTVVLGPAAYKNTFINDDGLSEDEFPNATAGYYIGYVTPGDAANRILGGNGVVPAQNRGIALSFNGVPLTNSNVQNGKYTAWIYNRILKSTSFNTTPGFTLNFANALRDRIKNFDAPSGGGLFDDATFKVKRSTDGGLVTPK